jgi:hypothetical protein
MAWLLGAAALILVLAGAGRFAWLSRFKGLPPASSRWAKLQQLASWAGTPVRDAQTPHEAAAVLSTSISPRLDVRPLASAYVAERYGGEGHTVEGTGAAAELDALYVQARQRLVRRSIRRFLSFGRR